MELVRRVNEREVASTGEAIQLFADPTKAPMLRGGKSMVDARWPCRDHLSGVIGRCAARTPR